MSDLIGLFNLLAPFFGLIGLGFFCGKVVKRPEAGLAWMQFFLIYVALPCLFYTLIADVAAGIRLAQAGLLKVVLMLGHRELVPTVPGYDAKQLSKILKNPISTDQFIQSHTPMRALSEYYKTVLVVGGEGYKTINESLKVKLSRIQKKSNGEIILHYKNIKK